MNKTAIDRFCRMASLEMPDLIDAEHLESEDDYDDYVLLTFSLENPMSMDEVLDCLEDQSELNILYHVGGIGAAPGLSTAAPMPVRSMTTCTRSMRSPMARVPSIRCTSMYIPHWRSCSNP